MAEESAGLELMAGNDRAAILDEQVRNPFCRHGWPAGVFSIGSQFAVSH